MKTKTEFEIGTMAQDLIAEMLRTARRDNNLDPLCGGSIVGLAYEVPASYREAVELELLATWEEKGDFFRSEWPMGRFDAVFAEFNVSAAVKKNRRA